MFFSPPKGDNGPVIRHYSTTVSRKLRDHPKMRVDLSDPDDRKNVARRVWRYKRPSYEGAGHRVPTLRSPRVGTRRRRLYMAEHEGGSCRATFHHRTTQDMFHAVKHHRLDG
ncbi:MAG: hypothetical protein IIB35_10815 [Gemmatimonadetes bacterium]|nr:hypothetical protein [Gemmatimonadota bacterium]